MYVSPLSVSFCLFPEQCPVACAGRWRQPTPPMFMAHSAPLPCRPSMEVGYKQSSQSRTGHASVDCQDNTRAAAKCQPNDHFKVKEHSPPSPPLSHPDTECRFLNGTQAVVPMRFLHSAAQCCAAANMLRLPAVDVMHGRMGNLRCLHSLQNAMQEPPALQYPAW